MMRRMNIRRCVYYKIYCMQGGERVMTEQGGFESAEKEIALESITFTPMKTYSNGGNRQTRRKEEGVGWKIKENNVAVVQYKRSSHRLSRNISFEEGEKYSSDEEEQDCSQLVDPQQSSFAAYYRDYEEVYRKKYNFGTNWIGRRQYYASSFVNPNTIEKGTALYYHQNEQNPSPQGRSLSFDSDFESGNLLAAFKVGDNEYDLILQNDINTKGNTQWFYFRISNMQRNVGVRMNIVNMRKSDSLFNYGMLPCVWSMQEEAKTGKGWFRDGRAVKYYKNEHQVQHSRRYYYTLTFTISTPHDNDVLRVAQSFPYTYSDLNNYLDGLEKVKYKKELMEREVIAPTIGRNRIEVLTIKQINNKVKTRPLIVVIARQHPGETPGSFVCEGVIDSFLGRDKEGDFLRKNYEIKVIPMLNPDGVCAGNYRTNLYGQDLNRRWEGTKLRIVHEASHIKRYISQLAKGREVAFVLDLHGHSRKMFSFFYGNPNPASPIDVRLFPLISSKLNPHIKFQDSTFATEDDKRNTARVQFGLMVKCVNIFTFESSFFGSLGRERERRHFSMEDYRQMGITLVKAMYIHQKGKELYESNPDNKDISLYKRALNELRNDNFLLSFGEKANSGSQSCPEECELKQSETLRLQQSEEYCKQRYGSKNIKNIKKIGRKELVKLPSRSQRQMQVMDIAQVNSMFPSNLLALIPASFLAKKRKVQTSSKMVQTDNTPLVRIYETCKQQENKLFYNPEVPIHPSSEIGSPQKRGSSNLLRSNILSRPHSESQNREMLSSIGLSKIYQPKQKDSRSLLEKHHKKALSCSSKNQLSKQCQTIISFNCMNLGQIRSKLQKEIMELKTIDPGFTSSNYNKLKQPKAVGKASSINVLQTLKLRKRQRV